MRWGLLPRGLAMGAAEVVPGVSGGTVAFVTGIYDELLSTLAGIDFGVVSQLRQRGPVAVWRDYNLGFLFWLGVGMVTGVLLFARVMHYSLEVAAPLVWATFCGVILYSIVDIARGLPRFKLLGFGLIGVVVGLLVASALPTPVAPSLLWFVLGGALAVSAWLLPAVSGSFLLLLLGLYQPVLAAVTELNWSVLCAVASGCAIGLLLFARGLHWLMRVQRVPTLSILVGFMAGSLPKLWPWQWQDEWLSPAVYGQSSGLPDYLYLTPVFALMGVLIIWGLSRIKV